MTLNGDRDPATAVELNGRSQISTAANQIRGIAGDLNLNTEALNINNSNITVSNPSGSAGNLTTTANVVSLDHGELTATTGVSQGNRGANIRLNDLDLLLMQHGSQIQTNATRSATGGNISIHSDFIAADPSENSDITANAGSGDGGRVDINTQGVFGIAAQPELTTGNDITASSDRGVQGVVTINRPNVDPSRGLTELPTIPIDTTNQLSQVCPTNTQQAEAVIAHELSHVVNRDTLTQAVAATVAGAISYLAQVLQFGAMFGGFSRQDDREGGNPIALIATIILAPLAATVIQMAISRTREFEADAGSARLTGNPRALARTLQRLEASARQMPITVNPAFEPLLIMNAIPKQAFSSLFSTHPSTEARIENLLKIEQELGSQGGTPIEGLPKSPLSF